MKRYQTETMASRFAVPTGTVVQRASGDFARSPPYRRFCAFCSELPFGGLYEVVELVE